MSTTKAWQDYLQRARWFGGKGLGARIVEITGLEWYTPADTWPAVRSELARLGQPIGPYDQMIAGHARSQGLIVVTNNRREFDRVPGLRIEDWVTPAL